MSIIQNIENNILREVGSITRCINSISDIKYKEINLQKGQFIFLSRICEKPGINQNDLSILLNTDKTTTAKAVQKLVSAGYIDRNQDKTDKRMLHLYPTSKAHEAYLHIIKVEEASNKDYYHDFNGEEKETLYRLLSKLRYGIEKDWRNIKKLKGGI